MIELEDLQNLVIENKLVQVENTNLYSEEAYQYLKNLVNLNRSIIFEKNTHRIYALGQYYGGDELKENLLYFSKILSIDIDDNIINEIEASKNSDILAFKAKDNISINASKKDNYTEIEIGYDINNIVDKSSITINNNDYNLDIENGKIKIKEYLSPKISLEEIDLTYDGLDENNKKDIDIIINSSIDISKFELFEIGERNCQIKDVDGNRITLEVTKDINPIIDIRYNAGIKENTISFEIEWSKYCYYGLIDEILNIDNIIELGKYPIKNDSIDNIFTIEQPSNCYAFYMCPNNLYAPYFIDNMTKIQGAWHRLNIIDKDSMEYIVYITDNSGLGKIEWEIINKK